MSNTTCHIATYITVSGFSTHDENVKDWSFIVDHCTSQFLYSNDASQSAVHTVIQSITELQAPAPPPIAEPLSIQPLSFTENNDILARLRASHGRHGLTATGRFQLPPELQNIPLPHPTRCLP